MIFLKKQWNVSDPRDGSKSLKKCLAGLLFNVYTDGLKFFNLD
jgi:hypothetical protein